MLRLTRRKFLARSVAAGSLAGLAAVGRRRAIAAGPLVSGTPHADQLGWRVGFAAYSFRTATTFEALDKIAQVGLRYAELFSWQKLSPKHPNVAVDPQMPKTLRNELKKKAGNSGVRLIGCYTNLPDAETAKAFFEYAADMGFEFIVAEPPVKLLDAVENLANDYKVDLALHNHPQPSSYWNPEVGLAALEGRSPRMGFCCDTGHWCRSGLDPVEMLRKVGRRAKTFHLKDLDQFGVRSAQDVIWGQGKGRIADILAEVHRLGLEHPYFSIEWERNTDEPLQTHAKSVAFFEQVAGRIARV